MMWGGWTGAKRGEISGVEDIGWDGMGGMEGVRWGEAEWDVS